VRTIKESLLAMIRGEIVSWPDSLAEVQYCYNTTVHSRHGSTPFSLMFARPHTPLKGEALKNHLVMPSARQLKDRLRWMTEIVFPAIETRTSAFAKRMHDDFMKRHQIVKDDFPAGALVMRQQLNRQTKAHPAWEGPYVLVRRTTGGSYILRNTLNEELSHRVPINQLRLISLEGNLSPDSFEVERILEHRGPAGKREYLVKWRSFSKEHNTWEAETQFDTLRCVTDYWASLSTPAALAKGQGHGPAQALPPLLRRRRAAEPTQRESDGTLASKPVAISTPQRQRTSWPPDTHHQKRRRRN
jgi:hypothetical protein